MTQPPPARSRRPVVLRLALDRRLALPLLAGGLFAAGTALLHSESLILRTTYPAPSGIYNQLVTTGDSGTVPADTTLARNAGNVFLAPATNPRGSVGVGTDSPRAKLDVHGVLKLGAFAGDQAASDSIAPQAPAEGSLYYDASRRQFRGYQQGAWTSLSGAGQAWIPIFGGQIPSAPWLALSKTPDQLCQEAGFSAASGVCRAHGAGIPGVSYFQGLLLTAVMSGGGSASSCYVQLNRVSSVRETPFHQTPTQIACLK